VKSEFDVVVIGAGMAGLSAAQYLRAAGRKVCVLEKSHTVGGRMSTRVKNSLQWDHGAQYFTAQSSAFRSQVAEWLAAKVVAPWNAPIGAWDGKTLKTTKPLERFVGVPFMKSPLQLLAKNLNVHFNTQVISISQKEAGWEVRSRNDSWCVKKIIIAVPAQQAMSLLPHTHQAYALAASIEMEPCWALMLAAESLESLPFAGLFVNEGALGWIAQDGTKPLRNSNQTDTTTWVLHATPEWSSANLEKNADEVASLLTQEFNRLLALWLPSIKIPVWTFSCAHRWRYARGALVKPTNNASSEIVNHVWPADGLALAGDWVAGGRVEGAYLSGLAAAKQLLNS
jgi:predicted NAD/FAD-dependent oxidoreductase